MNASKSWYRSYFAECSEYVKMKAVFRDLDMHPSNFYKFMKGNQYDFFMSIEMLERLRVAVSQAVEKFT